MFGGNQERSWWWLGVGIVGALLASYLIWYFAELTALNSIAYSSPQPQTLSSRAAAPQITQEVLVSGRSNIWDVGYTPDQYIIFTERNGTISAVTKDKTVRQLAKIPDIYARGEGGLMGLAVDPMFNENRYVYTCFNSTTKGRLDIRVARWRIKTDYSALEGRTDIVTGITSNSTGRHSGCRLAFGPDGYLWVGTGDAAQGGAPQDPKSLNGKILRVDRDGAGAKGNMGGQYDARIYSYGHRNTQGIAFFITPYAGVPGISTEHGGDRDDEVNPLKPGNFGWAPPAGNYKEDGVPMTDTGRFSDAVKPIWESGTPTQAVSGAGIIRGSVWDGWNGALAIATLKAEHLKILRLNAKMEVIKEEKALLNYGRLRAVTMGSDGSLYVTTDNGTNDQIIRVIPG